MKNLAKFEYVAKAACPMAKRAWFRDLLWLAFPSDSENELAQKAARVLDRSPRQVNNWLRLEHDARLRDVLTVMAIAGAEVVIGRIEGP